MNQEEWNEVWLKPPPQLVLVPGQIHVWRTSLSQVLPHAKLCHLSREELNQLADLKAEKARSQFIVSRWVTRQILSRYLRESAEDLQFVVSARGKPQLMLPGCDIEFNRSHTGDCWAMAVSNGMPVGVDIEQMRDRLQMEAIAGRWFTDAEKVRFGDLLGNDQRRFFYDCWTMKEAVLKAEGVGLSHLSDYPVLQKRYRKIHFMPTSSVVGCVAKVVSHTQEDEEPVSYYSFPSALS